MSNADKALLGVNTMVIAMGIVFIVLIMLSFMLSIQSKILKLLTKAVEEETPKVQEAPGPVAAVPLSSVPKEGKTAGEADLLGVDDEELAAVIMAAVSHASSIPLTSLKIRSIKSLEGNWNSAALSEQMR